MMLFLKLWQILKEKILFFTMNYRIEAMVYKDRTLMGKKAYACH